MNDIIDQLKLKIAQAKEKLPKQSREAIEKVDWRNIVLGMREKKGFTFSQIEELGNETELLLTGLTSPESYNKNLEVKMSLPKDKVNELVIEMNELVFKKIREELMKINNGIQNEENKKIETSKEVFSNAGIEIKEIEPSTQNSSDKILTAPKKENEVIMKLAGIEITEKTHIEDIPQRDEKVNNRADMLKKLENPTLIQNTPSTPLPGSMLAQKLAGSFKIPAKETEHSLSNISKPTISTPVAPTSHSEKQTDPYRLSPNE